MASRNIEIAVPSDAANDQIGLLLENFFSAFLKTQHYHLIDRVRFTGMEIDLLATHKDTGEKIFIECKAEKSPVNSNQIKTLLGAVQIRNAAAGWLISTSTIGKEAKGIIEDWQQKPTDERRRLVVYSGVQLVDRLVESGYVVDPEIIFRRVGIEGQSDAVLLITIDGYFWAVLRTENSSDVIAYVTLYDAKNGNPIDSASLISRVRYTNNSLSALDWVQAGKKASGESLEKIKEELDSIVTIPVADRWTDYRPSRPEDFVGRERLIDFFQEFIDGIVSQRSPMRIFAIKGPSGWGKSSSIIKLQSITQTKSVQTKTYMFTVDSRAARSRRFPEFAVNKGLRNAVKDGFIFALAPVRLGSGTGIFETQEFRFILDDLRRSGTVVCIVFDQFEELLYRPELEPVFDEILQLCLRVDELQENLAICFSWKTDGTIPVEHKAYSFWQNLADRRREYELKQLSDSDVQIAIGDFVRNTGVPLNIQTKRILIEQCQGYPWLLKKLCIHIYETLSEGGVVDSEGNMFVNIEDLFRRDLSDLSPAETACILQIARNAPADFFEIDQVFGAEVIRSLMNRRLVVKTSTRLNLYWDIFRDYVISGKVPEIPVSYIPQANTIIYAKALKFISEHRELTYSQLEQELALSEGSVDNLVRDMQNVGHVYANRLARTLYSKFQDEHDATAILQNFGRRHIVYKTILNSIGQETPFRLENVVPIIEKLPGGDKSAPRTKTIYAQKIIRLLADTGLVVVKNNLFYISKNPQITMPIIQRSRYAFRRGTNVFLAEAPPNRVVPLVDFLQRSHSERSKLEKQFGRNSVSAAMGLGLISRQCLLMPELSDLFDRPTDEMVASVALRNETVQLVAVYVDLEPQVTGEQVGLRIAHEYGMKWSAASRKRYGSALLRWAKWSKEIVKNSSRTSPAPIERQTI